MSNDIEILKDMRTRDAVGEIVLRTMCPICNFRATFRQISPPLISTIKKCAMVPIFCEGCQSVVVYSYGENKLCPSPILKGLEGLPEEIDKYYQEALRCISADCPNGAVTLFRKTIHAVGKYYKCKRLEVYDIITELESNGYITKKEKNALLAIKDIGNDGAHINENEPDMTQAYLLKSLIDSVLNSSIISDQNINQAKNYHSSNK